MPKYAALLRGVSPLNAKMPQLKQCFEAAGFEEVRTVLGSGNVIFNARSTAQAALERKIEATMQKELGRVFATTVRSIDALAALLASDPYKQFRLAPKAKRVVTFLHAMPVVKVKLPIEIDDAKILCVKDTEIFSAYVSGPQGPVFMTLIEKTFGKDLTTRTWDTVAKIAAAAA